MGNLDFSANADQLKELATYMASQINVPTIGIGGGYAPIGTIVPLMGTTAPQDYLACDGTVYNIADYPQLADYFESQFGESNHFGGNGTTTFAVPNLQGEFLRGTGMNSHANQGSGANVGEHQDGTWHLATTSDGASTLQLPSGVNQNKDYEYPTDTRRNYATATAVTGKMYTSRPTNTSVLFCIKAVVAGEVYSTEERVVGTWIDGKPLYQKTLTFNDVPIGTSDTWISIVSVSDLSIDMMVNCIVYNKSGSSWKGQVYGLMFGVIDNTLKCSGQSVTGGIINMTTLWYTKTTD